MKNKPQLDIKLSTLLFLPPQNIFPVPFPDNRWFFLEKLPGATCWHSVSRHRPPHIFPEHPPEPVKDPFRAKMSNQGVRSSICKET